MRVFLLSCYSSPSHPSILNSSVSIESSRSTPSLPSCIILLTINTRHPPPSSSLNCDLFAVQYKWAEFSKSQDGTYDIFRILFYTVELISATCEQTKLYFSINLKTILFFDKFTNKKYSKIKVFKKNWLALNADFVAASFVYFFIKMSKVQRKKDLINLKEK